MTTAWGIDSGVLVSFTLCKDLVLKPWRETHDAWVILVFHQELDAFFVRASETFHQQKGEEEDTNKAKHFWGEYVDKSDLSDGKHRIQSVSCRLGDRQKSTRWTQTNLICKGLGCSLDFWCVVLFKTSRWCWMAFGFRLWDMQQLLNDISLPVKSLWLSMPSATIV